ncbi:GTP pyrophosphokinase [Vibrio ishigakensis]|uniref:GTP pyrophosphokinase n=1 Tax=Vibrio ishigakensis TaxID=1481914 RepID=A0A0B8QGA9_9VIBR|nr:GTP pyrophosphokinase [Vibrio ishigakensis]
MGQWLCGSFILTLRIEALERSGLLKDISTLITNEKLKIANMRARIDQKRQMSIMDMDIEVNNIDISSRLQSRIEQIKDVISVKRLK